MVFLTALCAWFLNSHHALSLLSIRCKTKTNSAFRSLAFSRDQLPVFTLRSHCLLVIFTFVQIGSCDYFGFGCTTLNGKVL